MALIKFDNTSFNKIQNDFKKENNEILENLKVINKELNDIKTVLNTPQSSKIISEQIENLNKMEEYIRKNDTVFENRFNTIKSEYLDFSQGIKSMVGDVNE